ncbi:hypothetical protein JCM8208_000513 [Rhodotorula glutinis]
MPAALSASQRAASAYPAVPQRHKDSPSPTKKRRVDTGSGSRPAPHPEPFKLHSSPHKPRSNHLPSTRSTAQRPRPRASTAVEDGDADPNDPELQSRLHSSTLKLRDAWDDILRRHSLPAPSPPVPSRALASSPTRRHRPAGRTRAIPVEEDDIIDLHTMEIIQDRGVLRRSRAGAFALGGYTDAIDDVLVGRDTGVGEEEQGGGSGEEQGAAGEGSFEEDEDDAWDEPNALDSEAYAGSSDDELGDMDELPSLPSLLFREQRRRDADRRDQLRDFWEHEARARGGSEAGGGAANEVDGEAGGNRTLEVVELADDDDELGFFAPAPSAGPSSAPRPRRSSSSPLRVEVVTPSRKGKTPSLAPSTTAALRTAVGAVQLASSSPTRPVGASSSARSRRRPSTAAVRPEEPEQASSASSAAPVARDETRPEKKREKKRKKGKGRALDSTRGGGDAHEQQGSSTTSADLAPVKPKQGLQTPPNSFTSVKRSMPSARSAPARPPISSSPLREVVAVASPSPTDSPEPVVRAPTTSPSPSPSPRPRAQRLAYPSRSPSLEIISPRARARSPSPAVWTSSARPVSPELGLPASSSPAQRPPNPTARQQAYQRPTPTPTPPPSSRARRGLAAASTGKTPTPPNKGKGRRHSFELVIERKPSRLSMTPHPSARPASSERGATRPPRSAVKPVADDVEMRSPGGLSTPPLSKRSSRAVQAPASAPERLSVAPVVEPKATSTRRKGKIGQAGRQAATALRAAAQAKAKSEAEQDDAGLDDDPLLLESSPSPVKRRASTAGPRPQLRRAVTATPAPVKMSASSSRRVRERRVTTVAPSSSRRRGEASDDDDGSRLRLITHPLPTVATLAPTTLEVAPLHAVQLLHLVVSLSFTCHALAVLSYLLSPSHIVLLVLRVVLLVQFSNPRRTHPTRSLRFFTAAWALQAVATTAVHALTGSRGTKGPRGHAQGGIVLDFVGVAATPSTLHLVLIDVLLALFQLATLLVAFGATVPNDLDASISGEGARDYSALLGLGGVVEDDEEEEHVRVRAPRRRSSARKRRGYESVPDGDEAEDDLEMDELDEGRREAVDDPFGLGTSKPPSASSSSSRLALDPSAEYVRLPLIADLRLRTVWAEVRKSASQVDTERVDAGVRGLEEGRGA